MSDNQDESEFEEGQRSKMKTAMCLMSCPCTVCFGCCVMMSAMGNPPDARKLSEDEAKPYIDGLQGGSMES